MKPKKKAPRSRVKVPPGDLSRRNRVFISMFPWKIVELRKLPRSAKEALRVHQEPDLHTIDELIEKLGPHFKIGMAKVPMSALMTLVMNDSDRVEDFDTFDQYHCEYRGTDKVPRHKSVWPIILADQQWGDEEDETIVDGWHRFHSYYKAGIKNVPVLWYVDE